MAELTQLGKLLERARDDLGLSKREAARRANISESRWRQVVTGQQRAGEMTIPVNPRAVTVLAMARAVGVDESEALRSAGLEVANLDRYPVARSAARQKVDAAHESVERIIADVYSNPRIPEHRKRELERAIREAEATMNTEVRLVTDELRRWDQAG